MRKIIHFQVVGDSIYALTDDGTMWRYWNGSWIGLVLPSYNDGVEKQDDKECEGVFDLLQEHGIEYSFRKEIHPSELRDKLELTFRKCDVGKINKIFRVKGEL